MAVIFGDGVSGNQILHVESISQIDEMCIDTPSDAHSPEFDELGGAGPGGDGERTCPECWIQPQFLIWICLGSIWIPTLGPH